MSIIVDGIDIGGSYEGGAQTMVHNSSPAHIGSSTLNRFYFSGELDEMRVWNRAKSVSEIQEDMFREIDSATSTDLEGYWDFHEESGQILADLSTNSQDGVLGGDFSITNSDPTWTFSGAPIGYNSCIGNRMDVVGIWRVRQVASSVGLEIENVSMIQDLGDWVVFGNNSRFVPGYTSGDSELPVIARWNRHWCIDFSDEEQVQGGILKLKFDFSDAGFSTTIPPAADVRLVRVNPSTNLFEIVKDAGGTPLAPSIMGDELTFVIDPNSAQGLVDQFDTLDGVYTLGVTEVPLPVELSKFQALTQDDQIILSWQTKSETNNAGWEVEVLKGNEFESVAWVEGAGNSRQVSTYSYSYEPDNPGDYILRLKQIDYDGTTVYSSSIEAFLGLPGKLYVEDAYPNPILNGRSLISVVQKNDELLEVNVFDINGKKVDTSILEIDKSGSRTDILIETSDLISGIYFLRISSNGQLVNKKFVVLN